METEIEKLKRKREQTITIAKEILRNMRKAKIVDKHGAAEIWFTITVATMIVIAVARAKAIERAIARKMAASTATTRTPATWISEDSDAPTLPRWLPLPA